MNKNRLFILIAVISVLAMLIPVAAAPVSAQNAVPALDPGFSHDIVGDFATFTAINLGTLTVKSFAVSDVKPGTDAKIYAVTPGTNSVLPAETANVTGTGIYSVTVMATTVGESTVSALLSDNTIITADKKWGEINESIISAPKDVVVTWIEANKNFHGTTTINDTIIGTFLAKDTRPGSPTQEQFVIPEEFRADGAILHWYLLKDTPLAESTVMGLASLPRDLALNPVTIGTGTPFQETISSGVKFDLKVPGTMFAAATAAISVLPKAAFSSFAKFNADGSLPIVSTTNTISGDSGPDGSSGVVVNTVGEEAVLVVVIPEFPSVGLNTQFPTVIEWTKVNFWTSEMEKVPQVRWAGEKIILEKYFGPTYAGALVRFSLENQSPGALEGIQGTQLLNLNNTAQTVWDVVSTGTDAGWARVMLVSEDQGEVDVDLALYNQYGVSFATGTDPITIHRVGDPVDPSMTTGSVLNQHGFVVFYLKLESLTLTNVVGKRADHNSGLFEPPNPWGVTAEDNTATADHPKSPNTPDDVAATLNVSQDALLRARVRGWFMGDNMSQRPVGLQDGNWATNPAITQVPPAASQSQFLYTLPAGRWVLPDDWPILAGPNWKEMRLHWDVMDNPWDTVGDPSPVGATDNKGLGPYVRPYNPAGTLIAAYPVVGPFRPGLEVATAPMYDSTGKLIGAYDPNINQTMAKSYDDALTAALPGFPNGNPAWVRGTAPNLTYGQKTVVPNGVLDWWDAPMPPAKITFEILDAAVTGLNGFAVGDAGYFKDAFKTDIYYVWTDTARKSGKVYTNPFYWEMIPAFRWIPPFVNNGGYDWNSWDPAYGPYQFWTIINRLPNANLLPTTRSGIVRDNANFPSKVQVYSDNHGEAMVYLNGNYNLNPDVLAGKLGVEPPVGSVVGSSTVVAIADYPYFRKHNQIMSNTVTKTWTWGGMVLGPTSPTASHAMIIAAGNYAGSHPALQTDSRTSTDLMVWVWATDRDGRQAGVLGTQVDWSVAPTFAGGINAFIPNIDVAGDGINGVNDVNLTMKNIGLKNGFLNNTGGVITNPNRTMGTSFMRAPTSWEMDLAKKFWDPVTGTDPIVGFDPKNFAVAAIDLVDATGKADVTVTEILKSPDFGGSLLYSTQVQFLSPYPVDDSIKWGDANLDGKINMADVTAIERIILGLGAFNVTADANQNGKVNMGDVVKTERIILGIN